MLRCNLLHSTSYGADKLVQLAQNGFEVTGQFVALGGSNQWLGLRRGAVLSL